MRSAVAHVSILPLLLIGGSAVAQEATRRFGEVVEVTVADVEVVVTDSKGQPITGLGRDDFELRVEGVQVAISNFFAVDGGELVSAESSSPTDSELPERRPPQGSTQALQLAVVIDERHLSLSGRASVLQQLDEHLVAFMRPQDRVLVARLREGMETVQGFTGDRAAIHAALEEIRTGAVPLNQADVELGIYMRQLHLAPLPPARTASRNAIEGVIVTALAHAAERSQLIDRRYQNLVQSLAALERFVMELSGLPGRKALLYVSDGLPGRPGDSMIEAFRDRYQQWSFNLGQNPALQTSDMRALASSLRFEVASARHVDGAPLVDIAMRRASESGVTFYALTDRNVRSAGTQAGQTAAISGRRRTSQTIEEATLLAPLLQGVDETGGQISTNSRTLPAFLGGIRQDIGTYYSLGFSVSPDWQGSHQRIRVAVRREGTKVRYARGFVGRSTAVRLEDLVVAAALHGLDSNPLGISIQERGQSPSGVDRRLLSVILAIPIRNLDLIAGESAHSTELDIAILVRDEQGRESKIRWDFLPITIPNEGLAEAMRGAAGYSLDLEMRSGSQVLAIAVHDRASGKDAVTKIRIGMASL